MKVLLIGFGSIGKKHHQVLNSMNGITEIHVVTRQRLPEQTFESLEEISDCGIYDYFVIASETHLHLDHLHFINDSVENKVIFCEKPLFHRHIQDLSLRNHLYVGYVLRFHPLVTELKKRLIREEVISAQFYCGQYLPEWRTDRDYRDSYSSKRENGGGVVLDLSHELDLLQWLFGRVQSMHSHSGHFSDLEINCEDLLYMIGVTEENVQFNVSLDYISKIKKRSIIVHTHTETFELDLIRSIMSVAAIGEKYPVPTQIAYETDELFRMMHHDVLGSRASACTFEQACWVMNTIDRCKGDR